MEDYDTLVLPGGGIKGFYILGAVQALLDSGKIQNIQTYVGTSIGAIIGYLLAIGYTPVEILVSLHTHKWLDKIQYFDLVTMMDGRGATSFLHIHDALEKLSIEKIGKLVTLGKLREEYGKTLVCVAYNMTQCKTEYIGPDNYPDLPCIIALRMSANVPLVFDRFRYMDNFYIDGGMTDNFPIQKGDEIGQKVIGINLRLPEQSLKDIPEQGILSYFLKILMIPGIYYTKQKIDNVSDKCTIYDVVTDDATNPLDFAVKSKNRLEMFSKGYNSVREKS
jgi:predicted acylesterase/phospholipase RssA